MKEVWPAINNKNNSNELLNIDAVSKVLKWDFLEIFNHIVKYFLSTFPWNNDKYILWLILKWYLIKWENINTFEDSVLWWNYEYEDFEWMVLELLKHNKYITNFYLLLKEEIIIWNNKDKIQAIVEKPAGNLVQDIIFHWNTWNK